MSDSFVVKAAVVSFGVVCIALYIWFLLTHHCVSSHVEMRTDCYGGKNYMNCNTHPEMVCDAWEEDK